MDWLIQAALEAPRVLNLNNSKYHSGPYGIVIRASELILSINCFCLSDHHSFCPGEDVVFIANDWHTALLPCYLKTRYQAHGIYKNAKVSCHETRSWSCFSRPRYWYISNWFLGNHLTGFQVAFCIHNIAYQGRFAFADFSCLNLPDTFKSSFDFIDGYVPWSCTIAY